MVIIIGTGLAGYMLAKEYRKQDQTTVLTLLTQDLGDFYSKPLLSTALTHRKAPADLRIHTAQQMATDLKAKIITETVVQDINPQEKTISCKQGIFHYDKLILACGANPIPLVLQGNGVSEVFSINTLEDYTRFQHALTPEKKHIAILGSGLVGCEFANDLLNAGYHLQIISLDAYPLARFIPEKMARIVQTAFVEKGVQWHLKNPAVAINKKKNGYEIALENGARLEADLVISAVGLRPNLELARKAQLNVNKGIVVNQFLQTSNSDIFALGDCAEVLGQVKQYVAPLLQGARLLAKTLVSLPEPLVYPPQPIVLKTPLCPMVILPVPSAFAGEWCFELEDKNGRALFYDQSGLLRGFVLIGNNVREKQILIKETGSVG